MPPKLPKLVPWRSPTEFIQVHQWFYPLPTEDGSPDIRAQECAIRRVRETNTLQFGYQLIESYRISSRGKGTNISPIYSLLLNIGEGMGGKRQAATRNRLYSGVHAGRRSGLDTDMLGPRSETYVLDGLYPVRQWLCRCLPIVQICQIDRLPGSREGRHANLVCGAQTYSHS